MKKRSLSVFTVLMAGLLLAGVALAATVSGDQPDSSAYVGYGWNAYLTAFKGADGVSIPFKPTGILPPIGYQGDFYVDEFTDAKIKQAWQELKAKDPEAAKKILAGVSANKEYRSTGWLDPKGAVNGNNDLKLTEIRRPAFFGQAPYFEDIAKVEKDTYIVEFTVPRDPYEQLQLKQAEPVKLRGWFIKGKGVPDAKGNRVHTLLIFTNGQGAQMCAIRHPDAPCTVYNVQTKRYEGVPFPNKNFQSEGYGPPRDRQYLYSFHKAGFDVLMVDKRGHGISGGVNGYNAAEMAEDIFRMLDQLESGEGLTVLASNGQLLQGKKIAGLLLRGMTAQQVPVLLGGMSQGSIITCLAMQKNLEGWTAFNEPDQKFSPAKKYNFKGAILLADFAGGLGFVSDPDLTAVYQEAAYRLEKNTMGRPTSEILANIDKWPAVLFGKGLWDQYQSAEGTYEAYQRAKGLKELIFFRGPHSENWWGLENVAYLINKMTEFAVRAVVNPGKKYPELKSFKEAVLSSAPYWESTSRP
jgi:pimeloyl-ACP methyl ester carboxylesterase